MKSIRQFLILAYIFLCSSVLLAQVDTISFKAIDGPYVFHKNNNIEVVRVSDNGLVIEKENKEKPLWVSSQDGKHTFEVKLHDIKRSQWEYKQPNKMLVISDPHGNIDAFISILKAQEIINDEYKWVFGKGHLVIIGDVFDRGDDVLPIFWLIYKLEAEASKVGGCVHFLLGNHEEMILRNDVRYANKKYLKLAEKLNLDYSDLWKEDSELGRWLLTRNTIEKIGDNLIVHAGLSKEMLEKSWTIPQINDSVSSYIHLSRDERDNVESAKLLFRSNGPLWYRGMVKAGEKYDPISEADIDALLKLYNVKRIYVGHTIFDEVSTFFDGKINAVNVDNKKNLEAGKSRGIMVIKNKKYLIYDDPQKREVL